ncbi:MAG: HAD-IA family hydrolase [Bacillota bacterium]
MKSTGILFDLDGTLLDTLTDLHKSVNYVLSAHSMPERSVQEVRSFVGNGAKKLIERAVQDGTSEQKTANVLADFLDYYGEHNSDNTMPYEGIMHLVSALKNAGYKLGVVTNKPHKDAHPLVLKHFGASFDVIIGQRDGVPAKPACDMMYIAKKELQADNVIYVGDSEVDVKFASNAEVPCVLVSWGFRTKQELVQAGATTIIDTVAALYDVLAATPITK